MSEQTGRERGLSVTVKYKDGSGKGYDMPWAVFHGAPSEIREDVITYFGLVDNETKDGNGNDLPLHYVVLNAQQYSHQLRGFTNSLPGKITEVKTKGG